MSIGKTLTMAAAKFTDVDEYIATFPAEIQSVLQQVRRTIHAAVPGTQEKISYDIPTMLRDGKRYVHFAGWAKHVSLYPIPATEDTKEGHALAAEFEPYLAGKGTLKFPLNKPIPYDLIGQVATRLAEAS
jgi:uncharacterized protein YdhG (YjbR/CyaY superfamily)